MSSITLMQFDSNNNFCHPTYQIKNKTPAGIDYKIIEHFIDKTILSIKNTSIKLWRLMTVIKIKFVVM